MTIVHMTARTGEVGSRQHEPECEHARCASESVGFIPIPTADIVVTVFYFLLRISLAEQCETQFETQLLFSTVIVISFHIGLLFAVEIQLRKSW